MKLEDLVEEVSIYKVEDFVKIGSEEPIPKVPYQIPAVARKITKGIDKDRVKAFSIYDWVDERVEYDKESNQKFDEGASSMIYSFKNGVGTCYSMTRLCISMAKSVGLDARIADVSVDCNGKEIGDPGHVCTYINLEDNQLLLDPAYRDADVKHEEYKYYSLEKTNSELVEDIIRPYKSAFKDIDESNYKSRLKCCNKALKLFSNDFFESRKKNILNEVGLKNVDSGNFELGASCFEEVLKLYPNDETATHNLGLAKKRSGK